MKLNSFKRPTTTKQVRILSSGYAGFRGRSTGLGRSESSLSFATESVTLAKSFPFSEPQFLPQ